MAPEFCSQVTEGERAGKALKLDGLVLIPIEKTRIETHILDSVQWHYVSYEPVAVVVVSESGVYAIDLENEVVSMEILLDKIGALEEIVKAYRSQLPTLPRGRGRG